MNLYRTSFLVLLGFSVTIFATGMDDTRNDNLKMMVDVLLFEKTNSAASFSTVLDFCQGKTKLLRLLSEVGISAASFYRYRIKAALEHISTTDPGTLMVAGARRIYQRGYPTSFLLDLNCEGANETLQTAGRLGLFKSPYRWLLAQEAGRDRTNSVMKESTLLGLPIRTDSHVTVARRSADGYRWEFWHYYRAGMKAPVVTHQRGQWEDGKLFLIRHSDMLKRRDLMGYPVGAAFVVTNNDTPNQLTDMGDRHVDTLTKAPYPNVYTVLELLNSTPFFLFSNTWGYTRVNGSWQGMVGMVQRGEADIAGTGSMLISSRFDAVTYLLFSTPIYGIFLFRAPPISYEYNLFGLPFSRMVWACSAFVLALCCLLLLPVMRYEERKWKRGREDKSISEKSERAENVALIDALLIGFAAVCQQGATMHARGIPSRIITLWLHFCVICLYASYTASIVVLLQTSGTSIRNLRDLWKSNIEAGAENAPYNTFFFKNYTDEVRAGIYRDKMLRKSPTNNFFTLEEGVDRLRTRFFAFHTITNNMYYMIASTWLEDEKCGLVEFDNYLPNKVVALGVGKDSPYKEMIRVKFALLHESGHRDWSLRRWVHPKPKCPPNMVRFSSVSTIDVIAALQIFAVGVMVSVFMLFLEIFVKKWDESRKFEKFRRSSKLKTHCKNYFGKNRLWRTN